MKKKQQRWLKILAIFLVFCLSTQPLLVYGQEPEGKNVLEAPNGVEVTCQENGDLMVSWNQVPDASAYIVYRSDDGGGTWTRVETTCGTSYRDTNAEINQPYCYRIQSMLYANESWYDGGYSVVVDGISKVGVCSTVNIINDSLAAEFGWELEGRADLFGILRSDSKDGDYQWIGATANRSYQDVTVNPGQTYYYKVYAAVYKNGSYYNGDFSEALQICVKDPYALTGATNLSIENQDDKASVLRWNAVPYANAYYVYRMEEGGTWRQVGTAWGNSYADSSVQFGKEYTYYVVALKYENGFWMAGPDSEKVSFKFLPQIPKNVMVSAGYGWNSIKISWQAEGNASCYGILRSEQIDGDYSWIAAAWGTSYNDAGLDPEKTYYYKIYGAWYDEESGQWYNGEQTTAVSGCVLKGPSQIAAEPLSYRSVKINWSAVNGVNGYLVWRKADGSESWEALGSTWQTEYLDQTASMGKSYEYRVQSLSYVDNNWGYEGYSSIVTGEPGMVAPQNFTAEVSATEYYGIDLSWTSCVDVETYGIMRAEHGTGDYQWIGAVNATSYTDRSGEPEKWYDYQVYAAVYDGVNWYNSNCSDAVSVQIREKDGAPVISNLRVAYVTGQGYYVACDVAAAHPITQMQFASWSDYNGQDDIVWKTEGNNGGFTGSWVFANEHNYEVGNYTTHVYVTDNTGKTSAAACYAAVPVFSYGTSTGWYDTNGSLGERYYLINGTAVTGWRYIGGLKYYFYPNGVLCQNVDDLIGPQSSYVLKLNKQMNCLTVYANDGINGYVIPVKSMLTSTGDDTPLGTFYTPEKYRWRAMVNGTYAQYATRLTAGQGFLFHSITYEKRDNHTLLTVGYNMLGINKSLGCIRLVCGEAYWIYSRCPLHTKVVIYNDGSNPGPFYRPIVNPIPSNQRWDPTDPNP
ncbi:GBS Bsp-like repeat-containing protein [Fusibacillus kribbianus]|uniref:GBS Bsp-like repeat-containing protein n=1 Tax=Fusibacillus kribbianus TaxID=3044208 RepID=A0AAP4BDJ9_9FIRM|nr:GBS Bsp-like repeat-containing protein [Ruminococcus sp. YH-rum2234]MDI9242901.1 GBS Bsp-like repeat-containing protein [Ruminococcus sp. YH-rum2234]